MSQLIVEGLIMPAYYCWEYFHQPKPAEKDERRLYTTATINLVIPEHSLAPSSLQMRSKQPFANWTKDEHRQAFTLQKTLAERWKAEGTDYLFYGKVTPDDKKMVFEAVPYPKTWWFLKYIKQLLVLVKIRFGGYTEWPSAVAPLKEKYKDVIEPSQKESLEKEPVEYAPCAVFCNKEILERQKIYENEHLYVLLNLRQIGQEKQDILIVPKGHIERFEELTLDKGIAMSNIAQKINNYYQEKAPHKIHMFDKTGSRAGQTVSHFHRHMIIEKVSTPESKTFWAILKNMIWPYQFSKEEMKRRSDALASELGVFLERVD